MSREEGGLRKKRELDKGGGGVKSWEEAVEELGGGERKDW